MMVTKKRPEPILIPVQVSREKYEAWYSKPISLGEIVYKHWTWRTSDGQRFNGSKDAIAYLAHIHEAGHTPQSAPAALKRAAFALVHTEKNKKKEFNRNRSKGEEIQLPANMSLDDLKQLVNMADKLRGLLDGERAPAPSTKKQSLKLATSGNSGKRKAAGNDSHGTIQKAVPGGTDPSSSN